MQELGVPDLDVSSWNGIYAPAKTPPEALAKLRAVMAEVLAEPDIAKRFTDLGLTVRPTPAPELHAKMKSEIARWTRVIEAAGIERQ